MKNCFLFPGQGAQYPGMGRDLWESSLKVKDLFHLASDVTSMDLEKLLFEGSEEELKSTDKTQIAVTLVNLSARLALKEKGVEADGCSGFSLGEYSALYEAGVIELEDLFAIVKARGELMERASRNLDSRRFRPWGRRSRLPQVPNLGWGCRDNTTAPGDPGVKAGMAAVLGLEYDEAVGVLKKLKGDEVYLANYSSPIQIVLAGTHRGLEKARPLFEEAGAMRFITLRVSGPFHSPLLEEARAGLKEVLSGYTFKDPVKPVYANASGKAVGSGAEAKELCVRQIVSTVLWVNEEQSILNDGYDRFLEVGPGSVLSGLWKSFYKKIKCKPAGKLEDIEKLIK